MKSINRNSSWHISIIARPHPVKIKKSQVRRSTIKILDQLKKDPLYNQYSELTILFTSDKEIRVLNKTYRKKDKATDVLSFSNIENGSAPWEKSLGEIVISLDTAKFQAKKYKVSFESEILRLLIHGVLHLFGYDHEKVSKNKANKMRRQERRIFQEICCSKS